VRAGLRVALITPAAIKARSQSDRRLGLFRSGGKPLPSFPGNEIEGEKNDQKEKDPDRPEKTLPDAVPSLLRVEKNPESRD